jgi:CRP-like cAMP-binding protein
MATLVVFSAAALFTGIIANIDNATHAQDSLAATIHCRLEAIAHFMQQHALPESHRHAVLTFYNKRLMQSRMVDTQAVLAGLPKPIQADIAQHLNDNLMSKIPIFKGLSEGFLRILGLMLRHVSAMQSEYIIKRGEFGNEMYFITSGLVEIWAYQRQSKKEKSEDRKQQHKNTEGTWVRTLEKKLYKGKWFGQSALFEQVPRITSAHAESDCELFMLRREDFETCVDLYPGIKGQLLQRWGHTRGVQEMAKIAALEPKVLAQKRWSMIRHTFVTKVLSWPLAHKVLQKLKEDREERERIQKISAGTSYVAPPSSAMNVAAPIAVTHAAQPSLRYSLSATTTNKTATTTAAASSSAMASLEADFAEVARGKEAVTIYRPTNSVKRVSSITTTTKEASIVLSETPGVEAIITHTSTTRTQHTFSVPASSIGMFASEQIHPFMVSPEDEPAARSEADG